MTAAQGDPVSAAQNGAETRVRVPVTIISFGYSHARFPLRWLGRKTGGIPVAYAVYDLRDDCPRIPPGLRDLTGRHATISAIVLTAPGIPELADAITAEAVRWRSQPQPITIAVGCADGRQASVAVATEITRRLAGYGIPVILRHRDISRPPVGPASSAVSLRAYGIQPSHFTVEPIPPQIRLWRAITRWHATS